MGILAKAAWLATGVFLCAQPGRAQAASSGALEGDVVDASTGQGISGARVRLESGQSDPQFTTTDESGHFRFAGLTSQSYRVDARYPGYTAAVPAGGGPPAPVRVVPPGPVRLEMRRAGAIVGKVTDASGVPLAGMPVTALQRYPDGDRRSKTEGAYQHVYPAYTDDLGEYRIGPLAAGSYYLLVKPISNYHSLQPGISPPHDPQERDTYYPRALRPSAGKPLELGEGKELRADVQMIRQSGVKVSGRVIATETPGLHVTVRAWPILAGASPVSGATPGGDRFSMENLLPGQYLLEAGQYADGDRLFETPLASAEQTVEIGTADLGGIDLILVPTPTIEGKVVFESGCTAAPVWVLLDGFRGSSRIGNLRRSMHTAANGQFVFPHLLPGRYRVYVSPESNSYVRAVSAKLGDAEVLAESFELTAETKAPLHITATCRRR